MRSAQDAFGSSVGDSSLGIYNAGDVRGFSAAAAGNLRIEGLYYDEQGTLTSHLQAGSTIRVGLSAQNYAFPAPTGIVDYALRSPGAAALVSAALQSGPFGGRDVEVDVQAPVGAHLGIAAGASVHRDERAYGGTPDIDAAGALFRYHSTNGFQLTGFASRYVYWDSEPQPLIFSSGAFLPKPIERGVFRGQSWADFAATSTTLGLIAEGELWGFDAKFGVFRSIFNNGAATADLLFDTDISGSVADRVIVRERDDRAASTSGELRLQRSFTEGNRQHSIIVSLRARDLVRRYGGGALIDLGASRSDERDPRPDVATMDGPKTFDRVRQTTEGLAYQLKWLGVGELGLGLQTTQYDKRVDDPDPLVVFPESRASPLLPTATAAWYATRNLVFYGSYTRGLEESPAAPIDAVNRNEAPPAILTHQYDGGLRWTITPRLTAVLGAFDISKPYFNTDSAGRFRELGVVTNRGVEMSIAGEAARGLSLVAGAVFLDSSISGEEVDSGLIGRRPVGWFERRLLASVDYEPPALAHWSFDATVEATSARNANAANSLSIPARMTADVGVRYRFNIDETRLMVRAVVANIADTYGWDVGSSGYFTPIAGRTVTLSLAADF